MSLQKIIWLLGILASLALACDTKTKNVDACGDGFVDPGEACDTTVGELSCASLGYYNAVGELRCNPDCTLDDSSCGGRCGDGLVQEGEGETCDGGNLNGQTCQSLGYTGGTLACGAGCVYDVTGCAGKCGNGVIDVDEGEVCDGEALSGETCETQGYHGGALTCEADCSGYNLDACETVGRCGDGIIQAIHGEVCDGADLDEETCWSQGYYGGVLACGADCLALDLTDCAAVGRCGDGIIQLNYPEWCDGENLDGQTCESQGYSARGGTLACTHGCMFDGSACLPVGDNADLATLAVSGGTLTPAFTPGTKDYAVVVPNAVSSLTVTATAADAPWATVEISPAQPMSLVEGMNPVTVTVTAEDGTTTGVYTVLISRASPGDLISPNIGMLKQVPAGVFQRDATATNLSTVSAFRMSQFEITRAQWTAVTGWADPSDAMYSSGVLDPVQNLSWYRAMAFCNKLSLLEGLTPVYTVSGVDFSTLTYGEIPVNNNATWDAATVNWAANGYRLPTQMEWLWAAMGADTANPGATNTTGYAKAFAGSTGSNVIDDYAWYSANSGFKTHPAGTRLPNELGLYDLSGNVWEWMWDWHAAYPAGTLTDYRGPASGSNRVGNGGNFTVEAPECTLAGRYGVPAYYYDNTIGFRVVRP